MDLTSTSDWQMRYLETLNGNHGEAAVEKASTMTHAWGMGERCTRQCMVRVTFLVMNSAKKNH